MTTSQPHHEPGDTPMRGIYVAVVIVEALVIAALYALGRMYS